MSKKKRVLYPFGAGLAGMLLLTVVYFGIMTLTEGLTTAWALFWYDRFIVIPIIAGFGIQAALYAILKFRIFAPASATGPSGVLMGASGTTSTVAMLACCVHHVTDVLPILGLTAATTFLARYRPAFLWISLGMTLAGIAVMLIILFKERHKALQLASNPIHATEIL